MISNVLAGSVLFQGALTLTAHVNRENNAEGVRAPQPMCVQTLTVEYPMAADKFVTEAVARGVPPQQDLPALSVTILAVKQIPVAVFGYKNAPVAVNCRQVVSVWIIA